MLEALKQKKFNVPDFIYVPADDFKTENFTVLKAFLARHQESFKVIARSAHPMERFYKGGTFDSLETYADVAGIVYARKRMIKFAGTTKRLSIRRQQHFSNIPALDPEKMGVVVMPFVNGSNVMAKKIWDHWEFGYCRDRLHKVQSEPYITKTPHDRKLLKLSHKIQDCLGFPCEIEYIVSEDGTIHVVQAKDISDIEILEQKENQRSIRLEGLRRIRVRRNYRERPVYVMDTKAFYIQIISMCEDYVCLSGDKKPELEAILDTIKQYEETLERFALQHQRFCVLGLHIQEPEELYQIANHYLDDIPEVQQRLSQALHNNIYKIDNFLSEADTLITKNQFRINLCGHDAYGIDTVRNPLWSVYWNADRNEEIVRMFRKLGFKTGDTVGIDIDNKGVPTVYRL